MRSRVMGVTAAILAAAALGVAAFFPRTQAGHGEPAIGGESVIFYEYYIVLRVAVAVVGLAAAAILWFMGERMASSSSTPSTVPGRPSINH